MTGTDKKVLVVGNAVAAGRVAHHLASHNIRNVAVVEGDVPPSKADFLDCCPHNINITLREDLPHTFAEQDVSGSISSRPHGWYRMFDNNPLYRRGR